MLCTTCGKSMRFNGIGLRGKGKDKEKWKCTCGFMEYIENWDTHPPENEMKGTSKKKVKTTKKKKRRKKNGS